MRKKYAFIAIGVLLLILLISVAYEAKKIDRTLVISRETTRIFEPVRKDGRIDYVAALNRMASDGITPEENAMVLYMQAIGPAPENVNREYQVRLFDLLGVSPPPPLGNYFQSPPQYIQASDEFGAPTDVAAPEPRLVSVNDALGEAVRRPWAVTEFPLLAEWLARNEEPLALVSEGSQRTKYYYPLVTNDPRQLLISVLLPVVQSTRNIGQALCARAMLRVQQGDTRGARHDLLVCHRLARHVAQGATLIESLVGFAIDGIACEGDRALANHVDLSPDEARQYQAQLGALPPMPSVFTKMDQVERMMFLDIVAALSREGAGQVQEWLGMRSEDHLLEHLFSFTADNFVDWNQVLRSGNAWYDRFAEAGRMGDDRQRREALAAIENELKEVAATSKDPGIAVKSILSGDSLSSTATSHITGVLVSMLIPAISAAYTAEERADIQVSLTHVAIALAAYKSTHGEFPESLEELAPTYIGKLPLDRFSAGPLRYRLRNEGYLLYSVGPNLKDDEGLQLGKAFHTDDISVSFPPGLALEEASELTGNDDM